MWNISAVFRLTAKAGIKLYGSPGKAEDQTRESYPTALSPILQSGKWDLAIKNGTERSKVGLGESQSHYSRIYSRHSTYAGVKQEDFDPYQLEEKPVPPRSFRLVKWEAYVHILGWPAQVIFGQLLLQGLGWGFLAVITTRGPLALPLATAVWAENNPHILTLGVTLLSTFLAACSSFFFSYALRRS
ncbi:hypothetical protein GGX14DRAFT_546123, partial [Mycena pura]